MGTPWTSCSTDFQDQSFDNTSKRLYNVLLHLCLYGKSISLQSLARDRVLIKLIICNIFLKSL